MKKLYFMISILLFGMSKAQIYTPNGNINGTTSDPQTNNVGIGTTSPSEKLEINGNVKAIKFITSGGAVTNLVRGDGTLNTIYDANTVGNNIDFNLLNYDANNVIKTQPIHVPNYTGQTNAPENDYGQLLTFGSLDGLFPTQLAFMNTGNIFYRTKYSQAINPFNFSGASWKQIVNTSGGSANYMTKFVGGGSIGNSIIYDNGTNVGIGTTNPQAKLDVNGGVKISDVPISTSVSDQALVIDSQGNVKKATTMNGEGVYPSEYFTSVTFPASFTKGNYIEFASASPIAAAASGYYEISIAYTRGNIAAAATHIAAMSHSNPNIWREAGMVNANDYVSWGQRNFTIDVNGATNKFRIRAINTLGISADLPVFIKIRSINMVSSFSSLNVTGTDNSVIKLQPMTNEWNLFVGNPFSTESASIGLKVNAIGNVGIGIMDPLNKLDVNGTVHAKEVKVDLSGWADYVFKKDYDLRTLEEVERYIEEKGHLPNIPSTKEVTEGGINLGEMNSKLLEKIEELTLYSIEQNNKNKEQEQQLKVQTEKIEKLEKMLLELTNKK